MHHAVVESAKADIFKRATSLMGEIILAQQVDHFRDAHLPENETEERFLETCEEYKAHIENEYDLPTRRDNPELYDWMRRSKDNYNSYIDNRRHYLTELFNYIHSLGFDI